MSSTTLLDTCGRHRSPATLASFHQGRPPHNKGQRYPADPPAVEEIIAVMRAADHHPDGVRLRGLIVVLWRAGLRISEALALSESDLDCSRGAILVRRGKGGKRREVGMDRWAWEQLHPVAAAASCPAGRRAVLRPARADPRSPVGGRRRPLAVARCGRPSRGAAPLRTTSTAACSCGGDVARGGAVAGHPAPSAMPTSRSHRCTCAGSTTRRSSMPSTSGLRR